MGKVATSPLPPRGSPPLQSGGTESELAHKWARWLHHPCRLGGSQPLQSGGTESELAHKWARWLHHPCRLGGPHRFRAGRQNQRWPTSGQGGYITPAASGVPTASERGDRIRSGPQVGKVATSPLPPRGSPPLQRGGTESEVAHKWARWLHYPCRLGLPTASERRDRIRSGPQVGKVATSPLPPRGSPPLQSGGTESEVAHKSARWLHHPCRLGGPHRFRAGGQNQRWPTSGQGGYITPAASGVPTASEREDRIRGGPQVGKVATSPLPPRGSPPLQSGGTESEVAHKWARWLHHPCRLGGPHRFRGGGQNQRWPTSGQGGYITPAAWGSPPLPSGGTESEVAHKWARWLHHPCRLGGPHHFRAGGQNQKWPTSRQGGYITPAASGVPTASERGDRIRGGPQVGKVATSPLPPRGVPTASERGDRIRSGPQVGNVATSALPPGGPHRFRAGGQNPKWPTGGQGGYITPAAWGSLPLPSGGTESEVAHKWARWLHHFCRLGGPHGFRAGGRIRSGPQVGKVATSPLPPRGSPPLQSGGTESELAHKLARWLHHPCRLGGPHRFRAGRQNQRWPTSGQGDYITPAAWGSRPLPSGGTESEVAHKWARWLYHPCRLGGPHHFRARGQNQKWPTSRQGGYITPAASGVPTASERGDRIRGGPQVGKVATSPLPPRGSPPLQSGGTESELAHKWARWLHYPCRLGVPTAFERGDRIRSGPQVGKVATSPLPSGGSPPLQSGGTESELAHKWARWLHHHCRLGVPTASERGDRIRSGPQVGKVATSPLPPRGVPTASERGDRIRIGQQVGKVATSPLPPRGSPPLQSGGTESEVAHKWARWLHHPCRLGGPHRFRAGGQSQNWPTSGQGGYITLAASGGPNRFRAGGQNQNWPTSGQGGYITPAASGVPTASEREDRIRGGPQVGKVTTLPLPPGAPHRFRAAGQNQKWPTSGQGGYITPAASGVPTTSERGDRIRSGPQVGKVATSPLPPRGSPPLQSGRTESEVAHKWARWLHHPCRLGGSRPLQSGGTESEVAHKWARWLHHPCRLGVPTASERGDRIRSGPQVGKVATLPLPLGGPYRFRAGGQNQKWPTSGQGGYITPAASEVPTASERGAESEVAHKWARWLHHLCPLGGPHHFRAGGQNQNWPTSGQDGYITPAAWGSPPLPSGGTESEVAHKWARWLHHPCRPGGPHGFRAGGRIRSGPQVGKVATSPLPPRGSPPLQSGGQNQKWPTSGQGGYITRAAWRVPTASERGDRIRIGPQVGKVATSPLPPRGSPPLQSGGTESEVAHKWARWLHHPCRLGGSPPLQSGGTESELAHKWARWLHYPCRLEVPTASERGDRNRSGPQVGKMATLPLPLGGPHGFRAGRQNQKWPTSGQGGYITPAASGSRRLQSGGQNQKWPTSGQGGYITPAASGVPGASERGADSEVAHKWARWLHHLCRLGGSPPLQSGGTESELAHKWARWLHYPCRLGVPTASERGDRIRSGPQVGKMATLPLPLGGPHVFRAGGQNQKWPTSGQGGYITPAASGVPTASERGAESEVAHKWARWLHHPCRLGGPHRFRAGGQNPTWPKSGQGGYITPAASGVPTASERGDRIRGGPQVGKVATSPLSPRGSPPRQSGGAESELAFKWARWLHHPCHLGVPHRFRAGGRIKVAHKWTRWLDHPCRLGVPHRFRAGGQNQKWPTSGQGGYITPAAWGVPTASKRGDRIRIGPQVGKLATSPLPPGGSHRFKAGGQNQKWPTSGQGGYITPAAWGVPTASERGDRIRSGPQVGKVATSPLPPGGSPPLQSGGTESKVAHKWARWLHQPCRLGGSHRFKAGGQNQNWPTSGQGGYITPAASRVPIPLERGERMRIGPQVGKVATSPLPPGGSPPLHSGGTKSELAHKWARSLHHPCRLGGPQRVTAGGQNQNWPSSGQGGYITPAASGVPTASERGDRIRIGPQVGKVATSPLPPGGSPPHQSGGPESEVAHKWARWHHHSCRLGGPHRFRAGGQNQNWPTSGQGGYITPAASGVPTASQRGAESEVAHKWARWLHHPCRLGVPTT